MKLTASEGKYYLNGEPVLLRGGELQYFRIRTELWEPALDNLTAAHFNAISTYIPWIWHEPVEGQVDFVGETHTQRNLKLFLELCASRNLPVIVRPGPYIYAEYRGFGHPLWLGESYPETVMRDAKGEMVKGKTYHNYSLMQPLYQEKVRGWYTSVIDALKPYFENPVVAMQIDNETGLMYGSSLGQFDFNPDTVKRYRTFLHNKYEKIEILNDIWSAHYSEFAEILPPRRPFHLAESFDWQEFLESWLVSYLGFLRNLVCRRGVKIPLTINEQATFLSPANAAEKAKITDFYGYDLYIKASGGAFTADSPFLASTTNTLFQNFAAAEKPLTCFEMGAGWWDARGRVDNEATLQSIMTGIAHGMRGHFLYTVHDGKDPEGAEYRFQTLLGLNGEKLPRYEAVERIHSFLANRQRDLVHAEPEYDSVAFLYYQPYTRFQPSEYFFSQALPDPMKYLAFLGYHGLYAAMATAGVSPRIIDLAEGIEQLSKYKVLVLPTKGYLDQRSFKKLKEYVRRGGNLITLPEPIQKDEYGRELEGWKELYPLQIKAKKWIGISKDIWELLIEWLIKYEVFERRNVIKSLPTAQHLADLFEPVLVLERVKLPRVKMKANSTLEVKGDYLLVTFDRKSKKDVEVILKSGNSLSGYRTNVSEGTSCVIGTLLAGCYTTSVYYRISRADRKNMRRFVLDLLSSYGVQPRFKTDMEVEVVLQKTPGKSNRQLVYIINRLPDQRGTLELRNQKITDLEMLFTFNGSSAKLQDDGLINLNITKDDVVVLRVAAQ